MPGLGFPIDLVACPSRCNPRRRGKKEAAGSVDDSTRNKATSVHRGYPDFLRVDNEIVLPVYIFLFVCNFLRVTRPVVLYLRSFSLLPSSTGLHTVQLQEIANFSSKMKQRSGRTVEAVLD